MTKKIAFPVILVAILVALSIYFKSPTGGIPTASFGDWSMGGHDKEGTYYSPLTAINAENLDKLGFAWSYDMNTYRGQEATPIVVDGVMYTSGNWGHTY